VRPEPPRTALLRRQKRARQAQGDDRQAARRRGRFRPRACDRNPGRHRLGGRDPHRGRGAGLAQPRRADRDGGEPALRRARDPGHPRVRAPYRLAELDFSAPERRRRQGSAQGLRQGREGRLRLEPGVMEAPAAEVIRQHLIDPEICIRCNTCESTCPVGAISHDSRNYVVDADKCEHCMACVPPCPTGSIDNWRAMPRARAYSTEAQFGWDVLPAELPVEELGAAGASAEALAAAPPPQAALRRAGEEAAFDVSAYAATIPPWSA